MSDGQRFCQLPTCGNPATGFLCIDHWRLVPPETRREIVKAKVALEAATAVVERTPTNRPARLVMNAKATAYAQAKNRAMHDLERAAATPK